MIKTKTIATVGPASSSAEMLGAMIDGGVDVFRLNFSHGTLAEHKQVLDRIRRLAAERDAAVAVMGDLAGPKIRIGEVKPGCGPIRSGDELVIQREPIVGDHRRVSTTWPGMLDDVQIGQRVLINDGHIQMRVESKAADSIVCRCIHGGPLSSHKGINLPDTELNVPSLTPKDLIDLEWAIEQQVDYLAISFVRHPDDVRALRQRLRDAGSDIAIISKIEKPQAIEQLDDIIDQSDGILVARGDLGVEMELAEVPPLQKRITVRCQAAGKAVIIATEMLQSMVTSPTPTRAEVSDVANAILDTADAVMLSAESAIGEYPAQAVAVLQNICEKTEAYLNQTPQPPLATIEHRELKHTSFLAQSAKTLADSLDPPLVAVWTRSGNSARLLSKHRFRQPIIALTDNPRTLNKLALNYGVISVMSPPPQDTADMLACLDRTLLDNGWVTPGDTVIVIAGTHYGQTGGNNALLIHTVGQG
ncbi:MAG: pyruvate kinase [Planctomycetes bacterium]|nr:pyruvate kinase [Planctomycetota bacterium]